MRIHTVGVACQLRRNLLDTAGSRMGMNLEQAGGFGKVHGVDGWRLALAAAGSRRLSQADAIGVGFIGARAAADYRT